MTIGWEDAFFWIQDTSPGSDPTEALEIFKTLERVEFNKINRVFTYIVRIDPALGHSCVIANPTLLCFFFFFSLN